ncbi:hypothetical protein CC78DRAFT_577566 [Lojkania enalia]|uniref:Large ribosomal subunit protein uL23m n=1 Tax=Lojkania enalia TaxID=147567 RepID=A0A9P4KII5_9PLEO|nr:hypothetical protein CC78DRAFT_577566 [Didymosphaeria enalia]
MPRFFPPARLKYKQAVDALSKEKVVQFGRVQVFLPKFTIALIRTPLLSPYHARFQVPLSFSKFDLRDYLYHLYGIKAFNIRTFVKQMPVRDSQVAPRQFFREESKKYMTVEMNQPFVWPTDPKSWEPWGKEEKEKREEEAANQVGRTTEAQRKAAKALREQAMGVLSDDADVEVQNEKKMELPRIDDPRYKIKI